MVGNLYGTDGLWMLGKGIMVETNGSNAGTDMFRYEQGFGYYKRFARIIGAHTGGKAIFISASEERDMPDEVGLSIKRARAAQKKELFYKLAEGLKEHGIHTKLDFAIEDNHAFELEYMTKPRDPEAEYHLAAAKEEGVPMYAFTDMTYKPGGIEFVLLNGQNMFAPLSHIGVIQSASDLEHAPEGYEKLFLGTKTIEGIVDNKPLVDFVDQFMDGYHEIPVTPAKIAGFGIKDDFSRFLDMKMPTFVRKIGGFSAGVGVDMITRDELQQDLDARTFPKTSDDFLAAARKILVLVGLGNELERYLTVYQPLIPATPILNPRTNDYHAGCVRSMVFSPTDGDPIVLGSQWRLAPAPLGDESASIEDRLRANLSRGATAMPLTIEQERAMNQTSITYIKSFEKIVEEMKPQMMLWGKDLLSEMKIRDDASDLDGLRFMFWWYNLVTTGMEYGIEVNDLKQYVTNENIRIMVKGERNIL